MAKRYAYFDGGTLVLEGVAADERVDPHFSWHKSRWRCEAMHYSSLRTWLGEAGIRDNVPRWETLSLQIYDGREPHDYQREALKAWDAAGRRGSVILPTGAGKTFVAVRAIQAVGRSTLVVVPTLNLLAQWVRVLGDALHQDIGIYDGAEKVVRDLTVTTYDSSGRIMAECGNRFKLVVWDEVHHLGGAVSSEAAIMAVAPLRLGMTATYPELPTETERGQKLAELLGPVVYREHIDDLRGSQLADYRTERIRVNLTDAEQAAYDAAAAIYLGFIHARGLLRTHGANMLNELNRLSAFDAGARRAVVARREMIRIVNGAQEKYRVLDNLLREYSHERILIFTESTRIAYGIGRQHLVPVISHETRVAERNRILEHFQNGTYRVIATSDVLNEGIDVPTAKVAIVMAGHSGTREYTQRLGRVLRKVENREALLFELVARKTLEESKSMRRRKDAYR